MNIDVISSISDINCKAFVHACVHIDKIQFQIGIKSFVSLTNTAQTVCWN